VVTGSPSNGFYMSIIRHACAGDKQAWHGDDDDRPLDVGGLEQAAALAPVLEDLSVRRLIASPTKRCVQTLQPLAAHLELGIERSKRLSPDGSVLDMLDSEWPSLHGSVLCTHGELMRPLLERVRERQVTIVADRTTAGSSGAFL
jgi:phosphohistidine phosphatase SixA